MYFKLWLLRFLFCEPCGRPHHRFFFLFLCLSFPPFCLLLLACLLRFKLNSGSRAQTLLCEASRSPAQLLENTHRSFRNLLELIIIFHLLPCLHESMTVFGCYVRELCSVDRRRTQYSNVKQSNSTSERERESSSTLNERKKTQNLTLSMSSWGKFIDAEKLSRDLIHSKRASYDVCSMKPQKCV